MSSLDPFCALLYGASVHCTLLIPTALVSHYLFAFLSDLSRNRLSELPAEVCLFVSLESLNLYQNCIRYIPEAIVNLQSLTFLNIR